MTDKRKTLRTYIWDDLYEKADRIKVLYDKPKVGVFHDAFRDLMDTVTAGCAEVIKPEHRGGFPEHLDERIAEYITKAVDADVRHMLERYPGVGNTTTMSISFPINELRLLKWWCTKNDSPLYKIVNILAWRQARGYAIDEEAYQIVKNRISILDTLMCAGQSSGTGEQK